MLEELHAGAGNPLDELAIAGQHVLEVPPQVALVDPAPGLGQGEAAALEGGLAAVQKLPAGLVGLDDGAVGGLDQLPDGGLPRESLRTI